MKIIIILSIVILLSMTSVSKATPDHQKIVCANCHQTLVESEDDASCNACHDIKDNKAALEQRHSQICGNCHAVTNDKDAYHNMHKEIKCENCHAATGAKPNVVMSNCGGCHGVSFTGSGNIHEVHKSKLDQICAECHGSTIPSSKPVTSLTIATEKVVAKPIVEQIYAETINYRKFTLYEVFKKLFTFL